MKLYYMKEKALNLLIKDIPNNLENYQSKEAWIDKYFIEKEIPNYIFDTEIEVPDYKLIIGGPETDIENAKIIFDAYKDKLNPVQAGDLRLWSYLTHVVHWDYMRERWNISIPDSEESGDSDKNPREKAIAAVGRRYFYNDRGRERQGLARLYWSAYLTYDESNENPYEYTEFIFSKQDIFGSVFGRSYGRSKVLVLAMLKELKKYPDISREDTRMFLAKVNQAGAITVLDFLDEQMATQLCESLMEEVFATPCIIDGCNFSAYNNLTGKKYEQQLKMATGKVSVVGKFIQPKIELKGKREGAKIKIAGEDYVIRDIKIV